MNDANELFEPETPDQTETIEPVDAEPVVDEEPEEERDLLAKAEEQEETPSESSTEKEDSQEKNGVSKRIDELTRLRREAERERDYWKQQAAEKPPEPVKLPENLKTLEDFGYDESQYQSYLFQQAAEVASTTARLEMERANQSQSEAQRMSSFMAHEDSFSADHKDYLTVTRNPELAYTAEMHEIVTNLDKGPDVMYHLGKNPDVSDKIARMPAAMQAVELGRIEERIIQAEKMPKQVTKTPDPAPKIAAKSQKVRKSPSEMSQSEFERYRAKVISKRR